MTRREQSTATGGHNLIVILADSRETMAGQLPKYIDAPAEPITISTIMRRARWNYRTPEAGVETCRLCGQEVEF